MGTANALTAATWSVMLAVAAGLGGFATGLLGVHAALTIDAATFFLSAALVAQIRWKPQLTEDRPTAVKSAFAMFREVIRYLFRTPDILIIALHKTALTLLLGTSFRVVQTAIAERIFPVGQQGTISMGLLFAVAGIGTGLGPLAMRYFTRDDEQ